MEKDQEIINLTNENNILKEELTSQKSKYKQLSTELGQTIFEIEDLELENRKLKQKIEKLEEENQELKEFKKTVESSTSWKITSMFK